MRPQEAIWQFVVVSAVVLGIIARQPLLIGSGALLIVLGLLGPIWAGRSLRHLTYTREIRQPRVFPDEPVDVVIQIDNRKLLPVIWLQVEDENPSEAQWTRGRVAAAHQSSRQTLLQFLSLGWFQRVRRHYQVRFPQRGYYALGPAKLTTSDGMGLSEATWTVEQQDRVVVYPRLLEPPALELLLRTPGTDVAVRHGLLDDLTRMVGVRPYQSGDPLRFVHWKATARTGQLQVKLFQPAVVAGTAIFLNLRTKEHVWQGFNRDWIEASISLAASLFQAELAAGHRAGFFANGQMAEMGPGPWQELTADAGQLPVLLEGLARVITGFASEMEALLARTIPTLPFGTTLLLVTAMASEELWSLLADARAKGYAAIVLWVGDEEAPAPPPGVLLQNVAWREVGGWRS
ncbi:MAG: DUF58 domain-containing protein [Mycobacterium leprae]